MPFFAWAACGMLHQGDDRLVSLYSLPVHGQSLRLLEEQPCCWVQQLGSVTAAVVAPTGRACGNTLWATSPVHSGTVLYVVPALCFVYCCCWPLASRGLLRLLRQVILIPQLTLCCTTLLLGSQQQTSDKKKHNKQEQSMLY